MSDLVKREDAMRVAMWFGRSKEQYPTPFIKKRVMEIPTADRPQKVVAQITFDEEKLREIVKEAVERFKEEYEITDRPQGEWIPKYEGPYLQRRMYCSVCGKRSGIGGIESNQRKPFCPNCGARMKGADDE